MYLKGHLRCENQFIALEQATRRVLKHRISDALDEILHTKINVLGRFGTGNRLLENDAERLPKTMKLRSSDSKWAFFNA